MRIDPGNSKVAADETVRIERLPVAVGTLLGTSILAATLISVDGLIGKDQWLTNALYGFCVAIPTLLLAHIWSVVDGSTRRAPALFFFLGAWATIFGLSCAIEHFDGIAGAFFYIISALCMAMLVVVVPASARAQAVRQG
jgi:hypothetical protein